MRNHMPLNISLNMCGTVLSAMAGLLTLPFMVRTLGSDGYGLWVLLTGATTYFSLLDFGISASLGRLIAMKRARDDVESIQSLVSTALATLVFLALLPLAPIFFLAHAFLSAFHVPLALHSDTYQAFVIMALGSCLCFPLTIFHAILFGYERFDIENVIDMAAVLGRTVLIFALVTNTTGLSQVAVITAGCNIASLIAAGVSCRHVEPRLRLGWREIRSSALIELRPYAASYWALMLMRSIPAQIGPFMIGHYLGSSSVTLFAIARTLVQYGTMLITAAARTATPRAAAIFASGNKKAAYSLFIEGNRFLLALCLTLCVGLISLGAPFLELWQRSHASGVYLLMLVLILGEVFPMSQWITASILSGSGRNNVLVALALGEMSTLLCLALLLIEPYGVAGVCFATAISAFVFRGLLQLHCGCKFVGISTSYYARHVVLVVGLISAVPLAAGASMNMTIVPSSYLGLLTMGACFCLLQTLFLGPFLLRLAN